MIFNKRFELSKLWKSFHYHNEEQFPSERGFTLVEALVAVAITGIIALVLMSVIRQVSIVTQSREAAASSLTGLNMAGHKISSVLKKAGRQQANMPTDVEFLFKGIDGDGGWESTSVNESRPSSNTSQDRLYLHILDSDPDVESPGSERTAVAFLLSQKETSLYQAGQWRLYQKRNTHDDTSAQNGNMMPATAVSGSEFSTSFKDPSSLGGGAPIGLKIDRLSFRYLDSDGNWVNSWDSSTSSDFPEAVEFALRSYDPSSVDAPGHLEPQWYIGIVSM